MSGTEGTSPTDAGKRDGGDADNVDVDTTDDGSAGGPLLRARGVKKYFKSETGLFERLIGEPTYVKAVDGVNIEIGEEETLGLVGESGCGKTTLGRVLARLYNPTDGVIEFAGQDIAGLQGRELKELRKRIQVIFQDPLSSLNPRKTADEIVGKPLEVHDIATSEEKRDRVVELFDEVGLKETHLERYPHEFSGGQRQRIGIARALAVEPDLIVADEPVSALDVSIQAQIINLMKELQNKYGLSYLFIAHDLSVVKHISDRVAVMYLGHIVEQGNVKDIYGHPQHPYTRALLHAIPSVESHEGRRENLLEGNPPSPIDPPTGCPFHTRCPEYIGEVCETDVPEFVPITDDEATVEAPASAETVHTDQNSTNQHIAACHWMNHSSEDRGSQDPFS